MEFLLCVYAIMKLIKNIWIITFTIISFFSFNFGYCGITTTREFKPTEFDWNTSPVVGEKKIENINEWPKTFTDKLEWIMHLPQKDEYSTSLGYVTSLIQISINRLLWILAFVALIYMLYCGFLVFSSWSDDKNASKGKKWIWTAAIALAWIGLSRLIISAMIRFINLISNS